MDLLQIDRGLTRDGGVAAAIAKPRTALSSTSSQPPPKDQIETETTYVAFPSVFNTRILESFSGAEIGADTKGCHVENQYEKPGICML